MELSSAKKRASDKSKQVLSLMEQMECLNVTKSNHKKRENMNKRRDTMEQIKDTKQDTIDCKENEAKNKRKSKIKGIDFLKEIDNLSKLTVVKLKYYIDANNMNVGRVKKAELVHIIKKDLELHFD